MEGKGKGVIFIALLIAAAALVLASVGCSSGAKPPESPQTSAKPAAQSGDKPVNLTIVGGSVGGMWSAINEGIAESIRRGSPAGSSVTPKPGKDGPNSITVSKGEAELGISYNVTALAALKGVEPYNEKLSNLRSVATLSANSPFAFITVASLPVNSVEELKAKKYPIRMSVNQKGSTMEITAKEALAASGITYEDIEKWGGKVLFVSSGDSMSMIKDGKLDAHPATPAPGASLFVEAALQTPLKVLPLSKEANDKMMKELGTAPFVLKAGTFTFVKEDMATASAAEVLIARAEMSDDEVYRITKAIVDNIEYLKTVHKVLNNISVESLATSGAIPLHPGAEKFYREKGALK